MKKIADALPPLLWPFRACEIYAYVLDGPVFVVEDPLWPRAQLVIEDIRTDRVELKAALNYLKRPHMNKEARQRAIERVAALRRALVAKHLRLRELSIGFRASPSAPVHRWP